MFDIYIKKTSKKKKKTDDSLKNYAFQRLEKCPTYGKKIYCCKSLHHPLLFQDNERAYIKKVMRFSGPRMMVYHPLHGLGPCLLAQI
jgi:hypothetical protein